MPRSIDEVLSAARSRLCRVGPREAISLVEQGGLFIDIRPEQQRIREGEVEAALVIERNVLEWRLDPLAPTCIPEVTGYDQPIVIMCSEGYTSSLAAASLLDLGFSRATDLEGGIVAWMTAGLPTIPGGRAAIP